MENTSTHTIQDRLDDLVPEDTLALRWGKSRRTLQRMRAAGDAPPYLILGRSVFYRQGDILEFEKHARRGGGL